MYIKVICERNNFFALTVFISFNNFFSEDHSIVEPLIIPDGCKPGDRIFVEGNQGTPDDQLNPKKKVCLIET